MASWSDFSISTIGRTLRVSSSIFLGRERFTSFRLHFSFPSRASAEPRACGVDHLHSARLEYRISIGFRTSLSQGKSIVHPDVNDHLIFGGKAKKEAIALMKFCAKPVPVVGSQCIALPKLGSVGISRNTFRDVAMNRRQEFGLGMLFVSIRLCNRKLLYRFRQFL